MLHAKHIEVSCHFICNKVTTIGTFHSICISQRLIGRYFTKLNWVSWKLHVFSLWMLLLKHHVFWISACGFQWPCHGPQIALSGSCVTNMDMKKNYQQNIVNANMWLKWFRTLTYFQACVQKSTWDHLHTIALLGLVFQRPVVVSEKYHHHYLRTWPRIDWNGET